MQNIANDSSSQELFGLAINHEILFSNHKSVYKRRIEKQQTKLLKKASFLKHFLREDEKILCVTTACSPMTFLEQWLKGLWIFYIKRCILVFTSERVFHIPTTPNYSYRNSIAQILYGDCNSIGVKGRTLTVRYKNEKKEKFYHVSGKEKNKLKKLLETILLQGQQSVAQTRTHLCPRCTEKLVEGEYICSNCSLLFKNKAEARKISITYPGGGYFYTRHPVLGLADAFVEAILTVSVITSLIDMIRGIGDTSVIIGLAILLAVEKLITVHDSNKFINEYIPMEKEIKAQA